MNYFLSFIGFFTALLAALFGWLSYLDAKRMRRLQNPPYGIQRKS